MIDWQESTRAGLAALLALVGAVMVVSCSTPSQGAGAPAVAGISAPTAVVPATPLPAPTDPAPSATAGSTAGAAADVAGDAAKGRALFHGEAAIERFVACQTCHTVQESDGVLIGPNLAGVGERAAARIPGKSAVEYLRRSIMVHDEFIVEGFDPGFVVSVVGADFEKILSAEQIDDLIAYLLTLPGAGAEDVAQFYSVHYSMYHEAAMAHPTTWSAARPEATARPRATTAPKPTARPKATATPKASPKPKATPVPTATLPPVTDPDLLMYKPCMDCHSQHLPSVVNMPHPEFPPCLTCHSGSPNRIGCPTCHAMHRIEPPHQNNPQQTCNTCHPEM